MDLEKSIFAAQPDNFNELATIPFTGSFAIYYKLMLQPLTALIKYLFYPFHFLKHIPLKPVNLKPILYSKAVGPHKASLVNTM
jgi:hypothetical protein